MREIEALNERFGVPGTLRFVAGPGRLALAEIGNAAGCARVALHGAQVLEFAPCGARPVLWLSRESWFAPGKPIRGGIPVCWPWFGPHPGDPSCPAHGFARLCEWEVLGTWTEGGSCTGIRLGLRDSPESRRFWDHAFEAVVEVRVGCELCVALVTRNTGAAPFTITAALHSYFAVSDVTSVRVLGFEGCPYVETAGGGRTPGVQEGPITIRAEVDRVFTECPGPAAIEDAPWQRRIRVSKTGSRSAVVWNPWVAKARRMPDFGDDEYPAMLCVETTNAGPDARTIPPGQEHRLETRILVEPMS